MKTNTLVNLRTLFLALVVGIGAISVSSCNDIVDALTYEVVVTNNTAEELVIFESLNSSIFANIGTVPVGETVKEKGFLIDANYTLEARNLAGDVVATTTFKQENDNERTWAVN